MLRCISIYLIFMSTLAYGQKFTWFGTTNIVIQDDDVNIMFDPFITHPSFVEVFITQNINTDKKLVKKWLDKAGIKNLDAVMVNHAHYDHAIDLGTIMHMYPAVGYGSSSAKFVAMGAKIKDERFVVVSDKEEYPIKSYIMKAIKAKHPAHVFGKMFMDGDITKPYVMPANPWDMLKGQDLVYYLKNNKGNIMFHPFANKSPYFDDYKSLKAKVLFLGLAKRTSTLDQIKDIIKPINPEFIIPIHYDNFFLTLKEDPAIMPTMNLDEWKETIKKELPNVKIIMPKVAKWIELKK
jgi:L-ascorbate metabolism protein UlaG (beta-lactamase superfamily)